MIYIQIDNLSTFAIATFGPVRASTDSAISENISNATQLINLEFSDKFNLRYCKNNKRRASIWSLLMNTVNTTSPEGTVSYHGDDHGEKGNHLCKAKNPELILKSPC